MKKNIRMLHGYQTTNRAKHNLKIHLIFFCNYRKKLLHGGLDDFQKTVIIDIEKKSDFEIIEDLNR